MDNRIGSFVRNQFSLFNENFIDSLSENSGDHIHDFRIAAKRIKMIFGFIQIVCKNAGMKTMYRSSGIREAFKAAGRYREISLNRHLLAELETSSMTKYNMLRNELGSAEKVLKRDYISIWKNFPYSGFYELEFKMLLKLKPLVYKNFTCELEKFIGESLSSVSRFIMSGNSINKLHVARKEIKKIKYGLEWWNLPSVTVGDYNFSHEEITMIEDKIGEWHDWLVFNRFLEDVNSRKISPTKKKITLFEPLKKLAGRRLKESERISVRLIRNYFTVKHKTHP